MGREGKIQVLYSCQRTLELPQEWSSAIIVHSPWCYHTWVLEGGNSIPPGFVKCGVEIISHDRCVACHHRIGIVGRRFGYLFWMIKVSLVRWVQNLIFWYVTVQLGNSDDYRYSLNLLATAYVIASWQNEDNTDSWPHIALVLVGPRGQCRIRLPDLLTAIIYLLYFSRWVRGSSSMSIWVRISHLNVFNRLLIS